MGPFQVITVGPNQASVPIFRAPSPGALPVGGVRDFDTGQAPPSGGPLGSGGWFSLRADDGALEAVPDLGFQGCFHALGHSSGVTKRVLPHAEYAPPGNL